MNYAKIFGNSHSLYVVNDEIKSRKFQNEIYTYTIVFSAKFPCMHVKKVCSNSFLAFSTLFLYIPRKLLSLPN